MAETLTPRNIGVENGQGFTALALQEWRQAEALSRDTLARAPECPAGWRANGQSTTRPSCASAATVAWL